MSMDKVRLANVALAAMEADGMSDAASPKVFRDNTASGPRVLAEALAAGVVQEVEEHFDGGGTPSGGTPIAQFTVGDGTSTTITITHGLSTLNIVAVHLRRVADKKSVAVAWTAPTLSTVVLGPFSTPPAASSLVASILYIAP